MENEKLRYCVVIAGFKSEEDAKAFIDWYKGSGEQSSADWQEEHSPESNWYTGQDGILLDPLVVKTLTINTNDNN